MKNQTLKLTILHTNDTHSYIENAGKRAFLIEKIRQENAEKGITTLLLDAGDVFSGDIYFPIFHGQIEAEILNLLRYDAMTLGNHDFDGGSPLLAQFIDGLKFPLVTSNVDLSQDSLLAHTTQNGRVMPYKYFESETGHSIGLFALTTLETIENGVPSDQVHFTDPIETARQMVTFFQENQVDKIVLLSHLGKDMDEDLAAAVDGIDVIIGGHSHSLIAPAEVVNDTIIVQAGHYGQYLGHLEVEYSADGQELLLVEETLHDLTLLSDNETDPLVQKIIDAAKDVAEKLTSQVVTEALQELPWDRSNLYAHQSSLGNVIADAFFARAEKLGQKPDLAIMNGGGIRSGLESGQVTMGDLINILPFSKNAIVIEVTGQDLWDAMVQGLYPQVSHLKLIYDLENREEKIHHLRSIEIQGADGQFTPLDLQKTYRVATNSFVGIGKDGFVGFKGSHVLCEDIMMDVDVLVDYLKGQPQPFSYDDEVRVIYLEK